MRPQIFLIKSIKTKKRASIFIETLVFFIKIGNIFNKNQLLSLLDAFKQVKSRVRSSSVGPYGDWGDGVGRALAWARGRAKVPSQHRQKQKVVGREGGGRPGRRPNYGKIGVRSKSR